MKLNISQKQAGVILKCLDWGIDPDLPKTSKHNSEITYLIIKLKKLLKLI